MDKKETDKLLKQAKEVLAGNWSKLKGGLGFTKPSQSLYPFQWNWDSGFTAYGYAHYDLERALLELRSLFSGQWTNGMLPHIIFHPPSSRHVGTTAGKRSRKEEDYIDPEDYFPGPDYWQTGKVCGLPERIKTSGLTQPPIHAWVIWHLYKQIESTKEKRELLEEFYPKLLKMHRYLLTERDPEGWGLTTIYHPWESGFDNSPRWDKPLGQVPVDPEVPKSYKRRDLASVPDPAYRPTESDYDRYLSLVCLLRRFKYSDLRLYSKHPFKVKDAVFSSILYMANERLKKMAGVLGEDTEEIDMWLDRFEDSLQERLWHEDDWLFYDFDVNAGQPIKVRTVGALLPIITGLLPHTKLEIMAAHFDKANFCGEGRCIADLAPSVGLENVNFQPVTYWRGPIWLNVNWLLWKGFHLNGFKERAGHLQQQMTKLVSEHGFYEYYHPETGAGLGADNFSWTAALIIDLLSQH